MSSVVPKALIEAYRATDYHVDVVPELVLRVEHPSPGLAELYARHGVTSAAFITAWNPYSQVCSRDENTARAERLSRDIQGLGLTHFEGRGQDPPGPWTPEESLLVLGLSRETAMELGVRHEQNAILWAEADAVPRLLLLR